MNKKAVAILLISALGFLIAAIAFFSYGYRNIPGGEVSYYVGSSSMKVFHAYNEAEFRLLYIDLAARQAFNKASSAKSEEEFSGAFASEFGNYLDTFNLEYGYNLSAGDYELKADSFGLKGVCGKQLSVIEGNMEYRFSPSFRVAGSPGFRAAEAASYQNI